MEPARAHGKICFVELPAVDVGASSAFYQGVFGWGVRPSGDGLLHFDDGAGQVSGRWVPGRPPARDQGLLVYIMVDDAARSIEAIVAAGGEITQPIGADAPAVTARFRDPAGNVLGIYEESGGAGER